MIRRKRKKIVLLDEDAIRDYSPAHYFERVNRLRPKRSIMLRLIGFYSWLMEFLFWMNFQRQRKTGDYYLSYFVTRKWS